MYGLTASLACPEQPSNLETTSKTLAAVMCDAGVSLLPGIDFHSVSLEKSQLYVKKRSTAKSMVVVSRLIKSYTESSTFAQQIATNPVSEEPRNTPISVHNNLLSWPIGAWMKTGTTWNRNSEGPCRFVQAAALRPPEKGSTITNVPISTGRSPANSSKTQAEERQDTQVSLIGRVFHRAHNTHASHLRRRDVNLGPDRCCNNCRVTRTHCNGYTRVHTGDAQSKSKERHMSTFYLKKIRYSYFTFTQAKTFHCKQYFIFLSWRDSVAV